MDPVEVPKGIHDHIRNHAVFTPEKATTKLRVDFDASAKCQNSQCLNDVLYKGLSMLKDLCGMLIRFLLIKTLMADVEKAYHQIGLNEQDRDTTRFLWLNDMNKKSHLRILTFISSSAFHLVLFSVSSY